VIAEWVPATEFEETEVRAPNVGLERSAQDQDSTASVGPEQSEQDQDATGNVGPEQSNEGQDSRATNAAVYRRLERMDRKLREISSLPASTASKEHYEQGGELSRL
jgi:hypothetical protein